MKQLKYKILLFILPVIVVPLLVASFISEHTSSEKLTESTRANLQTIAQGVIETLSVRFDRARQDLSIIGRSPEIRTYMAQQEFGLKVEAANSLLGIQRFLEEFYQTSGIYAVIRLVGQDGRILAQVGQIKDPVEDEEFLARFKTIKFGQESSKKSPVRRLPGLNTPVISVASLIHGQFKATDSDRYDQWAVLVLDLDWSKVVHFLNSLRTGRAILVGGKGRILSHPDTDRVVRDNMGEVDLIKHAITAPSGSIFDGLIVDEGAEYYAVAQPFSPDKYRQWGLMLQVPTEEVLAPSVQVRNLIMIVTAICVVTALIGILFVAGFITRPVKTLVNATQRVAKGDLTARVEISSKDELGELSTAFNTMAQDLDGHIEELKKTTAENERLASELEYAARLQGSIIPKESPRVEGYEIAGLSLPAKETGGDFYDYYTETEGQFDLTLADVSGKGLPAALFMLLSRSTIRTLASENLPPSDVMAQANALIERDSGDSGMFVTTFFGRLIPETAEFIYSNGGHNPPILLRKDGSMEELMPTGLALGLMAGVPYEQRTVSLDSGDLLVLYTDGVTEAINPALEEFGVPRLIETINTGKDLSAPDLIEAIRKAAFDFAGEEPQFDDFTLAVIRVE